MKLRDNIYSVGVVDGNVRVFHGYQTPVGTSYNAYLVLDEKVTLIDFVKAPFGEEFAANIREVLGDRSPDYIICNHVEPDHSGALPLITSLFPDAPVYGTANCQKELAAYYPDSRYQFVTVKAGDSLCTGRYTFDFLPVPMVHWPDSMATYLREEKILFSNDALGQHIGTGERTDEELSLEYLLDRAGDYYANIVNPFGPQVQKVLQALSALNIELVCPSHGVTLGRFLPQMLEKYAFWSAGGVDETRALVIYDTMWGTTAKLAAQIADEYRGRGLSVEVINLSEQHYSYAMARLLEAKYAAIGSPTLNNNVMPSVAAFLTYMKGLKPKNKVGMAFGSYGWSGESIKQIQDFLHSAGFETTEPRKALWNI